MDKIWPGGRALLVYNLYPRGGNVYCNVLLLAHELWLFFALGRLESKSLDEKAHAHIRV